MSTRGEYNNRYDFDLPLGLFLGLLGGAIAGILFAPKPGKALQDDVQQFVNTLPDRLNTGLSQSKDRYHELVDKTRLSIENELAKRSYRKSAVRMAEAKRREEQEAGYEY